jgi:hypothetical protein
MRKNIVSFSLLSILLSGLSFSCASQNKRGGFQPYPAYVSEYNTANVETSVSQEAELIQNSGMGVAIRKASMVLIREIPANLTLGVVNVSTNEQAASFVVEELQLLLTESKKFRVLDEMAFNSVRRQRGQVGEMNDAAAISLGQMVGANIMITVSITRTGLTQILTVKALDSRTAQIITMVRETF